MVSVRALFGTALGLSLAGCAMQSGGPAVSPSVAAANHAAAHSVAQGVQVASLQPVVGSMPQAQASNPPVVQQGTVLWRRDEDATNLADQPEISAQLQAKMAELQNGLQTTRQSISQQAQTRAELEAKLAELENGLQTTRQAVTQTQAQTSTAVSSVAKLAEASLNSMAQTAQQNTSNWQTTNVQLTQLQQRQIESNKLAELTAAQQAAKAAAEAEQRAKAYAGEQIAQARQVQTAQVAAVSDQVAAGERVAQATFVKPAEVPGLLRTSLQAGDPSVTEAVSSIARNVFTKDDKVVFAIHKAVEQQLQQAVTEARNSSKAPATRLGTDRPGALGEVALDPNRLGIAALLAPDAPGTAADAALAGISPAAGDVSITGQLPVSQGASLQRARRPSAMNIRQYKVVVHEDNRALAELLNDVLARAEPFAGPWQVKWKLSQDNAALMNEKFSLDAETTFDEFVSYLTQYIMNDRGVKLSFSLFDNERIIVISD